MRQSTGCQHLQGRGLRELVRGADFAGGDDYMGYGSGCIEVSDDEVTDVSGVALET